MKAISSRSLSTGGGGSVGGGGGAAPSAPSSVERRFRRRLRHGGRRRRLRQRRIRRSSDYSAPRYAASGDSSFTGSGFRVPAARRRDLRSRSRVNRIDLRISGIDQDALFSGRQVRSLIESINEQIRDGAVLGFGRNAIGRPTGSVSRVLGRFDGFRVC